jgi:hypothetical protein
VFYLLEGENLLAQVVRMGRGKFKIVSEQNGRDIDRIIDVSDVIYCDMGKRVTKKTIL